MSKIIPISENQALHPQGNVRGPANDFFKETLDKAIGAQKASGAPDRPAPLGEVRSTSFHTIETPSERIATQTGELLDLLDSYARDLGNPSKTLKDMAPLLNEINTNANHLLQETGNLGAPDEDLRKIAAEAAMTAQVELVKYNRGDYV